MALNVYMHSRNPYKTKKPSFKHLASTYDFFNDVLTRDENGRLCPDFKQPKLLATLARALLLEDFGLAVEFPVDRLIPTIPLRLNYILWLEDIIAGMETSQPVPLIFDIGTGSACIYPILGAKKNGWNFIGSEGDIRNYNHSVETVKNNALEGQINLFHVHDTLSAPMKPVVDEYSVLKGMDPSQLKIDVVMANPPFYEDVSDAIGAESTRSLSRAPAKSVSSAARQESQTLGGEVGFARRLAEDSLLFRDNVGVFTLMLGKKRSVPAVRRIMKELGITCTSVYEMCQGRVMRWGFAWSFIPNFSFPKSEFREHRKYHRPPLSYTLPESVSCLQTYTRKSLLAWVHSELKSLKMHVLVQKNKAMHGGCHLYAEAREDTWTHARRKRREALRPENAPNQPVSDDCPQAEEPHFLPAENDRKRQHDQPADDEEALTKRRRLERVCEEGQAWLEELERETESDGPEASASVLEPLLLKANFYVESRLRGYGGDEDEVDDDDGDIDVSIEDEAGPGVEEATTKADRLILSVEWLGGTNREVANRVLCYLKNKLK